MNRAEIYIDGARIDLGDFGYDVSLSISDINDIEKRKSGKSIIIKVPATNTNRQIFEHLDSNVAGKTNTTKRGKIVSGGFEAEGNVVIYESLNTNGNIYYRFQLIFDNANWVTSIGDDTLQDLDLSDYNHVYQENGTIDTISDSWVITDNSNYCYPVLDYGTHTGGVDVPIEYMRPAYRISKIIDDIFNTNGYRVNSDFFDSDFFKKLWLLNPRDFLRDITENDYLYKAYNVTNQSITATAGGNTVDGVRWHNITLGDVTSKDAFDNGYYDESNSKFVSDANIALRAHYNLIIRTDVGWTFTQPRIAYGNIFGNYVEEQLPINNGVNKITRAVPISTGNIFLSGEDVAVYVGFPITESANELTIMSHSSTIDINYANGNDSYTHVYNEVYSLSRQYAAGNTIDAADTLKSIKQIDLIKGLKQVFNLMFYTNENEKIVHIEPYQDFYTGASRDWSTKLDENRDISLRYADNNKNTNFKYKKDDNDTLQEDKQFTSLGGYTKAQVNINAKNDKDVDNELFASTIMGIDENVGLADKILPKIAMSDKTGPDILDVEPRILYYSGTASTGSWEVNGKPQTQYPYFYFKDDGSLNQNSLSFATLGNNKGLFDRYYDQQFKILDGIYDDRRIPQEMSCYVMLSESDMNGIVNAITNLDLRACVYFDNDRIRGHYYIQEIEKYNPDAVSHRCKFIRVLDRDSGFNLLTDAKLGDFSPADFSSDFLIS